MENLNEYRDIVAKLVEYANENWSEFEGILKDEGCDINNFERRLEDLEDELYKA